MRRYTKKIKNHHPTNKNIILQGKRESTKKLWMINLKILENNEFKIRGTRNNFQRYENQNFMENTKFLTTHKNSKPRIILKMKLNYEFLVSVSHETNMALAIVIALKK